MRCRPHTSAHPGVGCRPGHLGYAQLGLDSAHTVRAAERLRDFDRPALIAWSLEDVFFPLADAEALAATLRNTVLDWMTTRTRSRRRTDQDRVAGLLGEWHAMTAAVGPVGLALARRSLTFETVVTSPLVPEWQRSSRLVAQTRANLV